MVEELADEVVSDALSNAWDRTEFIAFLKPYIMDWMNAAYPEPEGDERLVRDWRESILPVVGDDRDP